MVFAGFDIQQIEDAFQRYDHITMFAVPTTLTRLVAAWQGRDLPLQRLKTIYYGGAPMYVADLKRAIDLLGPRLFQLFGQGESPMTITGLEQRFHRKDGSAETARLLASCGYARTGVGVAIVGSDGKPLPAGEVGEVITRSDCVMKGYWNNAKANAEALRDGWLHTGDLGSMAEDGLLTLTDRSKDLIISGGTNIYPREIEEVLLTHDDIVRGGRRRCSGSRMGRTCRRLRRDAVGHDCDTGRPRPALSRSARPFQASETLPLRRGPAEERVRQDPQDRVAQAVASGDTIVMRKVYVAGIGSTTFGRHADTDIGSLAIRAANAAIIETGLDRKEIGALYLGNFVSGPLTGQEVLAGLVADGLGLAQIPCTKVEGACASGGIAFRHAYLAIASGMCEAAIAVGVEKMTHASNADITGALNCAMDNRSDGISGLTFPGLFGLAWQRHAQLYGTDRAQVSAVVRKNKRNGLRNPLAQLGADLDDEAIAQSAPICDPLRLFDCCPASDGAAAVVLVSEGLRSAIQCTGRRDHGLGADPWQRADRRDMPTSAVSTPLSKPRSWLSATSGLTPKDIDLVELHDCFSIAEIIDTEDLGLVPRGQGGAFAREGRTAVGGDIPVNASGGLLSKGHPVGATGIGQIYESVLQLRGKHTNQVRDAAIAMTHNLGGTGIACTVNILRRTDA